MMCPIYIIMLIKL